MSQLSSAAKILAFVPSNHDHHVDRTNIDIDFVAQDLLRTLRHEKISERDCLAV